MKNFAAVAAVAALMIVAGRFIFNGNTARPAFAALSAAERGTLRDAPNSDDSDLDGDVNGVLPGLKAKAALPKAKAPQALPSQPALDCKDPATGRVITPDPAGCQGYPLLPNNGLTPGYPLGSAGVDSMPALDVLCADHYTASERNGKKVRDVPESEKKQALQNYQCACGIKLDPGHEGNQETGYELDHFISLELGGSNDHRNLWPQPYHPAGGQLGAHNKDDVEDYLKAQMCSGKMTQAQAIQQITTNWPAVYNQIKAK